MTRDPYELLTGLPGFLTLWLGAFLQVSTIVLLAGVSETSEQSPGIAVLAYFLSAVIYFAIDAPWVFFIEQRWFNYLFDTYGFERPGLTRGILLPVFFVFAAAANTLVVILPALDEGDAWVPTRVMLRGFTMGWFSYGNLALVQAWSYKGYPLEIVGIMPMSGGVFSMVSSIATTYICKQLI